MSQLDCDPLIRACVCALRKSFLEGIATHQIRHKVLRNQYLPSLCCLILATAGVENFAWSEYVLLRKLLVSVIRLRTGL